ncbi:hypothetical protein BOTBODRAFT_65259 [Botryobasidium botryosum FD-172 SS1]|uniref:AB hydrolase-1 domain-containing protein n=1 Tax=Botryobasidium botryosum (strain FD-172 SS1) TaxID=930990 RepID=A0A067MJ22_BOTB1|nr:hypothetical protein BOTBODRAFT_65259 [Botryobasidium botryosum FD-172 SS1]
MRSLAFTLSALFVISTTAIGEPFHPRDYPKKYAECDAVHRGGVAHAITKIEIEYVEVNPSGKRTLVLVHGWPSLWSSWSNQIQEFGKDYHLIVPNLRGFGASTHPGDVESSGTMHDIVDDLVCIMDKVGVAEAVCVGHDWGADVCWSAALQKPTRFTAVAALVLPYIPAAGDFMPVEDIAKVLKKLTYQIFFEKRTPDAIKELDTDIRRTLRATLRTVDSPPPDAYLTSPGDFLGAYDGVDIPPIPFFTEEEEDYFIEQYSIQGFQHTLQFYTHGNRHGSHEHSKNFDPTISQPALVILPTQDPVADWNLLSQILGSAEHVPKMATVEVDAAHWPQLEKPAEVNKALREWLDELDKAEAVRDEL